MRFCLTGQIDSSHDGEICFPSDIFVKFQIIILFLILFKNILFLVGMLMLYYLISNYVSTSAEEIAQNTSVQKLSHPERIIPARFNEVVQVSWRFKLLTKLSLLFFRDLLNFQNFQKWIWENDEKRHLIQQVSIFNK